MNQPKTIADFHDLHRGETCVIVCVGPNLKLTPPEWFDYPSFSVNSIFKYDGWRPTYYVGVDERLRLENGPEIVEKYRDIPKFFPTPDWDDLHGENIFRFRHREGASLYVAGQPANTVEAMTRYGITYFRVPDAVFQIAWYMGFTTMLMIGVQHKPDDALGHFWGTDHGAVDGQPLEHWFNGYSHFSRGMGVQVLNISEDTYVPADVLPRDDWQKWANAREPEKA